MNAAATAAENAKAAAFRNGEAAGLLWELEDQPFQIPAYATRSFDLAWNFWAGWCYATRTQPVGQEPIAANWGFTGTNLPYTHLTNLPS